MTAKASPLQTFLEETEERLTDLESGILALAHMAGRLDPEVVNAIFRDAHSIKAGANLLGYRNIETLSHRLENILDLIRTGKMTPTNEVSDALLQAVDRIHDLTEDIEQSDDMDIDGQLTALGRFVAPGGDL